ncbi:MAG: hypothetical protein M3323_01740 [Actinomycetota bacterium]|nr:hypothetical protein [Actinomycetota bacterium]
MTRKAMLWVGCLIAGASLAVMPSASAQTVCVGTTGTFYQCVDPTGGEPIEDCIFIVFPPCHPVSVPTPYVHCMGGEMGEEIFSCA